MRGFSWLRSCTIDGAVWLLMLRYPSPFGLPSIQRRLERKEERLTQRGPGADELVLVAIGDGRHGLRQTHGVETAGLVLREQAGVIEIRPVGLRFRVDRHRIDVPDRHRRLAVILEDVQLVAGVDEPLDRAVVARRVIGR